MFTIDELIGSTPSEPRSVLEADAQAFEALRVTDPGLVTLIGHLSHDERGALVRIARGLLALRHAGG